MEKESILTEFEISPILNLRLEHGETHIYVNNKHFKQCMYLLLTIPTDKIQDCEDINSIDEAAAKYDHSLEYLHSSSISIPPEVEFWGHCSNLQAWYEHGYDTRLLHRNIAFSLLKELAEVGDKDAQFRLKEEIALRLEEGPDSVRIYLLENNYLFNLDKDLIETFIKRYILSNLSEMGLEVIYLIFDNDYIRRLEEIQFTDLILHILAQLSSIRENIYYYDILKLFYDTLRKSGYFTKDKFISKVLIFFALHSVDEEESEFWRDLIFNIIPAIVYTEIFPRIFPLILNSLDKFDRLTKLESFNSLLRILKKNNEIELSEDIIQENLTAYLPLFYIKKAYDPIYLFSDLILILQDTKLFINNFPLIKKQLRKQLLAFSPTKKGANRAAYFPLKKIISNIKNKAQRDALLHIMNRYRPNGCSDIDTFYNNTALQDKSYQNFTDYTKEDVEFFETHTSKRALWGGKPTKNFVQYMYFKDKYLGTRLSEEELINLMKHHRLL